MCGSSIIYPILYTCTQEDTTSTGSSIATVRSSKVNAHETYIDALSSHVPHTTVTAERPNPTSIKAIIANSVVIMTHPVATSCDPVVPSVRPRSPATAAPRNGIITIVRYILKS